MVNRKNNIYQYTLVVALISALVCLPRSLPEKTNLWMLLQWSVTYEDGFVYRGLTGTIIKFLFGAMRPDQLFFVGILNTLFYITILCIFVIWVYKNNKSFPSFLFVVFLVVQPFITQWYCTLSMFERLDVILTGIFIASIIIIVKAKPVIMYISVFLLTVLSLVIHEGYAVYSIPTLFSIMLLFENIKAEKMRFDLKPVLYYLVPILAVYMIIIAAGKPELPLNEFFDHVNANCLDANLKSAAVYSIYYMSIAEKVQYAMNDMSLNKVLHLAATIILMSPTIYVATALWRSLFKRTGSRVERLLLSFVIVCTFSTTIAFFIALDTMRWWGYIVYNNLFALASLIMMKKEYAKALLEKVEDMKYIIIFAIAIALILGPTLWYNGFGIITQALSALSG